jgi:RNA polymerase-associated protein
VILYSGTICPFSHRCRFVLAEKGVGCEIRDIDLHDKPPEISRLNPYGEVPILLDREVILYESNIINEYLDERFPHPQLMPVLLETKARARLLLDNLDRELFIHVRQLERIDRTKEAERKMEHARRRILDRLIILAGTCATQKFMLGNEFSMVDVAVAPVLWRLEHYGLKLPPSAAPLLEYAQAMFARPAFRAAMTPAEKAMRR